MTEEDIMTTPEDSAASSSEPVEEPAIETLMEEMMGTAEIMEVTPESRPFMTTDFADYTVTEGLLLILVLLIFLQACAKLVKGGFSWLW